MKHFQIASSQLYKRDFRIQLIRGISICLINKPLIIKNKAGSISKDQGLAIMKSMQAMSQITEQIL